MSSKGGTTSGEGLWCAKTLDLDVGSITRLVHSHFAFPHLLVWLPEVAKILAALLRYARKVEMVAELCSSQPLCVPIANLPKEHEGSKSNGRKCVSADLPNARMDGGLLMMLWASVLKLFHFALALLLYCAYLK